MFTGTDFVSAFAVTTGIGPPPPRRPPPARPEGVAPPPGVWVAACAGPSASFWPEQDTRDTQTRSKTMNFGNWRGIRTGRKMVVYQNDCNAKNVYPPELPAMPGRQERPYAPNSAGL